MLETTRNLIGTTGWSPRHAVVFLFNNAEESLQDGSHLFSLQHPIRHSIRAVINLEAAGTTGPELLFQATSEQMIAAYAHVPYPFGTVLANDVFSSGIIMSDTDFRQFELYLDVTGLDMAVVGHSYFYHTRKDLVKYIQPGVAQHMAENTLALLLHLSSDESPLPQLTTGYTKPSTVYFSLLNSTLIQYSFATANALHIVLFAASIALVKLSIPLSKSSTFITTKEKREVVTRESGKLFEVKVTEVKETVTSTENIWSLHFKGFALVAASFIGALIGANLVALLMVHIIKRPLSWFNVEYYCMVLYGPAALTGKYLQLHSAFAPISRTHT